MMSRRAKSAFYACFNPVMRANAAFYRCVRAPRGGTVKVQLGPGQRNYFPGWINVDANMFSAKCDVWADLRYKLPFRCNTIDAVYSHHVIEHLPDLPAHFREMFRILKPEGIFRIGGPNGDSAMKKFAAGDAPWFPDFPDSRASLGGRLENFIFCHQEHLTVLTFGFLEEMLLAAGFKDLCVCSPITQTNYPQFIDQTVLTHEWETTPDFPHTLLVEGKKPAA